MIKNLMMEIERNIKKGSALAVVIMFCLGLGSCNERPDEGKGMIQHPQSHDHVMGEGLGEGELEAADDTLESPDTLQQGRQNEVKPEDENR